MTRKLKVSAALLLTAAAAGGISAQAENGDVIGYVYSTDIIAELNAFALDGKMAAAIEDIGDNRTYSGYGGSYIWNSEDRIISLDVTAGQYGGFRREPVGDGSYVNRMEQLSESTVLENVIVGRLDDKYALIDRAKGEYIIPYTDEYSIKSAGLLLKKYEYTTDVLDTGGNMLFSLYDNVKSVSEFSGGTARVVDQYSKAYYVDEEGNNIFSHKFDAIEKLDENTYIAVDGGQLVLLINGADK